MSGRLDGPLRDGALVDGSLVALELNPSPGDARDAIREELLRPEYDDRTVLGRVIEWFARHFDGGVNAASASPLITTMVAVSIFASLAACTGWLLARTRRTTSLATTPAAASLDAHLSAAEYRRSAESAFATEDFALAIVSGFRALARDQIDRGHLADLPQATARELGALLAKRYPPAADSMRSAAQLFDAVRYGDRPATRQQAHDVLGLDELLRAHR
ncbi:MAG: DUF4129 domain-containing protein [Nocardioides sp.]